VWQRGRGYFAVAALLLAAAWLAGKAGPAEVLVGLSAGMVLWALYFAIGSRAFSKGMQANTLGLALTLFVPLATWLLGRAGWPSVAALLPPGSIFGAATRRPSWLWLAGALTRGGLALVVGDWSRRRCEDELRRWYGLRHGAKMPD
jgi:hypothetical protein